MADDLPASTSDVVAFACELLGKPVPPAIPWEQAAPTMSAMARSFYAENRRVRNDRIKNELGVVLRYPTYREGLRAIAPGSWERRATSPDIASSSTVAIRRAMSAGGAEAMIAALDQGRDHLGRFEMWAICSEYSHGTSGSLWPCSRRTGQGSDSFLSSSR